MIFIYIVLAWILGSCMGVYPVHHRSIFKSSSHKQGLSVCRYLGKR